MKLYVGIGALVLSIALFIWHNDKALWSIQYFCHQLFVSSPSSKPINALPPCRNCNLILISLDTLRADRLGFFGAKNTATPALDRIAAQSTVFTAAFTNAYFTTPSHMSVFTSLYPPTHQVDGSVSSRVLDSQYTTLAEVLQKRGYNTLWSGPTGFKFLDPHLGFGRGFSSFYEPVFPRGSDVGQKQPAAAITTLHAKMKSDTPTFLFLHSFMTHLPYFQNPNNYSTNSFDNTTIPYGTDLLRNFLPKLKMHPQLLMFQMNRPPQDPQQIHALIQHCSQEHTLRTCFQRYASADSFWHALGQWQLEKATEKFKPLTSTPHSQELAQYRDTYDRAVQQLDKTVEQIWTTLEKKNTLVVIFSDHGEELFEHGAGSHTNFFEHTARVPVIIYHPKVQEGTRVPQLFSLVDLMPTILETLEIPSPPQTQGKAPWRHARSHVFGGTMRSVFVRTVEWKFLRSPNGDEQLFFLPEDPEEKNNLLPTDLPWVKAAHRRLDQDLRQWELEQQL